MSCPNNSAPGVSEVPPVVKKKPGRPRKNPLPTSPPSPQESEDGQKREGVGEAMQGCAKPPPSTRPSSSAPSAATGSSKSTARTHQAGGGAGATPQHGREGGAGNAEAAGSHPLHDFAAVMHVVGADGAVRRSKLAERSGTSAREEDFFESFLQAHGNAEHGSAMTVCAEDKDIIDTLHNNKPPGNSNGKLVWTAPGRPSNRKGYLESIGAQFRAIHEAGDTSWISVRPIKDETHPGVVAQRAGPRPGGTVYGGFASRATKKQTVLGVFVGYCHVEEGLANEGEGAGGGGGGRRAGSRSGITSTGGSPRPLRRR